MDLDFLDCLEGKQTPSYNQRIMVRIYVVAADRTTSVSGHYMRCHYIHFNEKKTKKNRITKVLVIIKIKGYNLCYIHFAFLLSGGQLLNE